jgi:hypothetical protein
MSSTKGKATKNLQSLDWIYKMDALDVDSTRLVVRPGGKITKKEAPALLRLHLEDVAAWFVTNLSKEKVKVEFTDFKLKLNNQPITPVKFVKGSSVQLNDGETDVVYGLIAYNPTNAFFPDLVKYTIRISGSSFGTIDYDPDLEIKP